MKKLYILFLLIVPFTNLYAKETWSEWQDEKPLGENLVIEEEERYKWYKIIEESEYTNLENEPNCEYFDKNDFILSDWIISYSTPEYKEYRTIKTLEIDQVKNPNLIGTMHIFDINSDKIINITEVTITQNLENIPYILTDKTDFNVKEFDKLNDNDVEEIAIDFENHDKISLTLNNLTLNQNMFIKISYINENNNIEKIGFATSHDNYNYLTFQNIYSDKFTINCDKKICELTINLEELDYETLFELPITVYQYQDQLFKCINKSKEYLNGYYTNIEDYIKDENTKKTYYRYKINYSTTLNNSNELVYNKSEKLLNTQNIEKKDTFEVASKLTENIIKNEKKDQNANINLAFYIIILLVVTITVYIIIKKIVNKNRAK